MPNSRLLSGIVAAAALAVAGLLTSSTPSDAGKDTNRFRCDARGAGQIRFHANYEQRARPGRDRKKFNAEFEVRPGGAYRAGQRVVFSVDEVVVGSMPLKLVEGELTAELELDTNDAGVKKPIPANFPAVSTGTVVEAAIGRNTLVGCELDRD